MRAFGVMLGGSVALATISAVGVVASVRAIVRGRRPPRLAGAISIATAGYAAFVRPWHVRWGSDPEDVERSLPGDDLPQGGTDIVHAVTIDAPQEEVWPWLAQIGHVVFE